MFSEAARLVLQRHSYLNKLDFEEQCVKALEFEAARDNIGIVCLPDIARFLGEDDYRKALKCY